MLDDDSQRFLKTTGVFQYYSELRGLVDKHKWHLSEKAGHDVGWERAFIDWISTNAVDDVNKLRKKYGIDK